MKNKKVKLGVLVLAAVTLFTATAFAATSGNDGYETLKQPTSGGSLPLILLVII